MLLFADVYLIYKHGERINDQMGEVSVAKGERGVSLLKCV